MATQLTDQDVFVSNTNPTTNVNPKVVGALWINYITGKVYVCKSNMHNSNVWILANPDIIIPDPKIGEKWFTYQMGVERKLNITYTNPYDYYIMVSVNWSTGRSGGEVHAYVNNIHVSTGTYSNFTWPTVTFLIPPKANYRLASTNEMVLVNNEAALWSELRNTR